MGLATIATLCAASAFTVSFLPKQADAHAFLLLPKAEFSIPEKNFYAYVVPGDKAPPFSAYITGDAKKNSQGFTANYKKLNSPSLKDFILKNQIPGAPDKKAGGTAECGFSKPDITPQSLPDHVELATTTSRSAKPIPYEKAKCVGKSRFTFYWLATHFAPFQVYIGCVPLAGATGNGGSSGTTGGEAKNSTTVPTTAPKPAPASTNASPKPAASSGSKCTRNRE